MACGVYVAQYLLDGLFEAGEASYAIGLMTNTGERGWANMLRVGSTMTSEARDLRFKPNLDWNHAWGSAPVNIIARKLAGIRPLAAAAYFAERDRSFPALWSKHPTARPPASRK